MKCSVDYKAIKTDICISRLKSGIQSIALIFILGLLITTSIAFSAELPEAESLNINKALWGIDVNNSVKGITVAFDDEKGLLYTYGITSTYIVITKPQDGHPFKSININVTGHNTSNMLIDKKRRHLIWVGRKTEAIRVIDLETHAIIAQKEPNPKTKDPYPVKSVDLDQDTGTIWVANAGTPSLIGYSPDLKTRHKVHGLEYPLSVAVKNSDLIYIIDSEGPKTGTRLLSYTPSTGILKELYNYSQTQGIPPPRSVHIAPDGSVLLVYRKFLTALDSSLKEKWKTPIPSVPSQIINCGSLIALIVNTGTKPESDVLIINGNSGQLKGTVEVGFEGHWGAFDSKNNLLFVGNAGDGSVSVIDPNVPNVIQKIDVANASEQVVVDPKTGIRYIKNRLGGSEIYPWKPNSCTIERWDGGRWPIELFIDTTTHRLYSLSFFDSAVDIWDLETGQRMNSLPLGIPGGLTDTISDMDFDENDGIAGFIFPETGYVASADLRQNNVLWAKQIEEVKAGEGKGPNNGHVAVDAAKNLLFIYIPAKNEVVSYDLMNGAELKRVQLTETQLPQRPDLPSSGTPPMRSKKPPKEGLPPKKGKGKQPLDKPGKMSREFQKPKKSKKSAYAINNLYVDRQEGRLFAENTVLDESTLTIIKTIPGIGHVFYTDKDRILAMTVAPSGQETLVILNPTTLESIQQYDLICTPGTIHSQQTFDPYTNKVYLTEVVNAKVTVYQIPK